MDLFLLQMAVPLLLVVALGLLLLVPELPRPVLQALVLAAGLAHLLAELLQP